MCGCPGFVEWRLDGDSAAEMENSPPNWNTDDPCGDHWDCVGCTGSRVTSLGLSNMNLKGTLTGDIRVLAELRSLLGLKGVDEVVVPDSQVFVLRNDTVT
ncbi:hypothetical protein C5167_047897 [Papaver somniferum]|uniref:Uncharacterized protein n=1 Tax=Papaver somniferum TaxID=3469 RepID=A0A4Y7LLP0_PAPSO|nr:hypothetical protein C5167_047897 [Papaver somniferum]